MNKRLIEYSLRLLYRQGANLTNWKTALALILSKKDLLRVNLRNYPAPIYLRRQGSDVDIFHEVLIKSDYNFDTHIDFQPEIIVDCGANIGLASVFFKQKYPKARIISIEPESNNYKQLLMNLEGYSNIYPYKVGVWGRDAHLIVQNSNTLNSSGFIFSEVQENTENSVKAMSIRSIMEEQQIDRIDILKIDVESAEKNIFEEDAEYWLSRTRLLIVELHDRMQKGCSKAFFEAILKYDFSIEIKGENIFCFIK